MKKIADTFVSAIFFVRKVWPDRGKPIGPRGEEIGKKEEDLSGTLLASGYDHRLIL